MDPIGIHHFWGFSPALDLQQVARTVFGADALDGDAPLNVLLVSPGDPRSVLKTIAQRFRHSTRPLHVRLRGRGAARAVRPRSPKLTRPTASARATRSFSSTSGTWRCSRGTCSF